MPAPPPSEPQLERGRSAYQRRAWGEAYDAFWKTDQASSLAVEDLERLAWCAALTGRDQEFLRLLERLHGIELEAGRCQRAARFAFWLAFRLFSLGEPARGGGWLARAQRLIDREASEVVEQGYLLLPTYHQRLAAGDAEGAHDVATRALEIGERFDDADLVAFARHLQGLACLRLDRMQEGLRLLDEAMIATTTGELSPILTGLIYCSVIGGCERVFALDRARQWTAALSVWCDSQPDLVFTPQCLIHRARVRLLEGSWRDALEETRRVMESSSGSVAPGTLANAAYEQAEIHRLRGEFEPAEAAYARASEFGREPQPGLALLRLAQGRCDAALHGVRRALAATTDGLERTSLLPAAVEIALAAAELDEARSAVAELEQIAARGAMEVVAAMAAHARGALHLAEGNAQAALGPLRQAFGTWQQVGAPYIAARVRMLLGQACRTLGDEDGAALELAAAQSVFERLQAATDLARLSSRPARPDGLTERELEVLRLVAKGLTNKAIAGSLHVSDKTVDRHLSNIFSKIGVSTRAAATAYAYEQRLI
jgi:DNA-binding CsgD family transcriptional regulator